MDIQCIGFIFRPDKRNHLPQIRALIQAARRRGIACAVPGAELARLSDTGAITLEGTDPDLFLAIGGDGTILHSAHMAVRHNIPVLGMNFGRVGFLSEIRFEEFETALERIRAGEFFIDERSMLACKTSRGDSSACLNDFTVYKYPHEGVAHISIRVGELDAGCIYADGVIVSTATGATGYSISAGGPIPAPGLDAAIITPICAHTLWARPIVCPGDTVMELHLKSTAYLSADGGQVGELAAGDSVVIRQAAHTTKFIRFTKSNLYQLIREKLS